MLDHEPSTWDSVALLCGNEPFRMRQNEITARVYAPVRVQSSLNWGKCVTPNLSLDWSPRSGLRACYTTRSLTGGIGGFNGTHPGAFLNKHWLVSESSRHRWWHPVVFERLRDDLTGYLAFNKPLENIHVKMCRIKMQCVNPKKRT